MATASWDATLNLYDLAKGEVVRTLGPIAGEGKAGGLYSVAFAKTSPDILGCTSCDKSIYLWKHTTGELASKLSKHTDEVNGLDFHESQQVMVTASDDKQALIWDFAEGVTLRQLDSHTKQVYGCTFLGVENQYLVATCCFDTTTRIFDMRNRYVVAEMKDHNDDVIGLHYTSNGRLLATGSDDGHIYVYDTRTWKQLFRFNTFEVEEMSDHEVKRVAFSPDGSMLAAACSSGRVLVYDVNGQDNGFPIAQLNEHTDCVFDVAWGMHPRYQNSKILVSASHDHKCCSWRQVS